MTPTMFVHILAGAVGLIAGAVALAAAKGARWHRAAGRVFVYAMLAMALLGMAIAIARNAAPSINVPAALTTAYLVLTGVTTVSRRSPFVRRLDRAAMVAAAIVGPACVVLAVATLATSTGARAGMAYPLFMFGGIVLAGAAGDRRALRAGPLHGAARLRRHLWRLCVALFIAALSFFVGQADELPSAIRIPALLPLPGLLVLAVMAFWLWRLRRGRGPLAAGQAWPHAV